MKVLRNCPHLHLISFETYQNCKDCGVFISKKNKINSIKCRGLNFRMDMSPANLLEKMLVDQFKTHNYNPNAKYLKMRKTLVQWLMEVGIKLKLSRSTVQIGVAYLDYILSKNDFASTKYHLLGLSCLIIAAKYDELDARIPLITEFQRASRFTFRYEIIKECEMLLLKLLEWNLKILTHLDFLTLFLAQGIIFEDDQIQAINPTQGINKYALYFNDLCLENYEFKKFPDSILGVACIVSARKCIGATPLWNPKLDQLTSYKYPQIKECFDLILSNYADVFEFSEESNREDQQAQILPKKILCPNKKIANESKGKTRKHAHKPSQKQLKLENKENTKSSDDYKFQKFSKDTKKQKSKISLKLCPQARPKSKSMDCSLHSADSGRFIQTDNYCLDRVKVKDSSEDINMLYPVTAVQITELGDKANEICQILGMTNSQHMDHLGSIHDMNDMDDMHMDDMDDMDEVDDMDDMVDRDDMDEGDEVDQIDKMEMDQVKFYKQSIHKNKDQNNCDLIFNQNHDGFLSVLSLNSNKSGASKKTQFPFANKTNSMTIL